MVEVTLKGKKIHVSGSLPKIGSKAPHFVLVDKELNDRKLADFSGKKKILSIVPSLDTGVCLASAKRFNQLAKEKNLLVINISADLPFAQSRICGGEELTNIETLSMMRDKKFAEDYGVLVVDGPLKGICARAILVLDEKDKVLYTELVSEITEQPNYDKALAAI